MQSITRHLRGVFVFVIAAAFTALAIATFTDTAPDAETGTTSPVRVPGPTGPITYKTDTDDQAELHQGDRHDALVHEDAVDEKPPSVPAGTSEQLVDRATAVETAPPLPPAGAQTYSCKKRLLVNRAPRRPGVKVVQFVVHWGVVPPEGGLAIMRRLFNTPSFKANATFGMAPDGTCEQWANFDDAPWTQLTFNQVSESIELAAMGSESRAWWLRQPVIRDGILAALIVDRLRARGLPLRWVNPSGCTPKAGWTDHNALDCGNNHCDVTCGNFPRDVVARQVRRYALGTLTQRRCQELRKIRGQARRGKWTRPRIDRARSLKRVLGERRSDRCR